MLIARAGHATLYGLSVGLTALKVVQNIRFYFYYCFRYESMNIDLSMRAFGVDGTTPSDAGVTN